MKILDLRPGLERYASRRWRPGRDPGGGDRHPRNLWAVLVDAWLARRVASRGAPAVGPLVVSVGNLALGGTGKTPVIMALAQALAAGGHSGCVLTRGFRSPLAGPLVVTPDNGLAGDEARLMAASLTAVGWPVIQARDRVAALGHALAPGPAPDFILVEDGHQTRGVGRHLDILILDRWRVAGTEGEARLEPLAGPVFPLGPYRESVRGAARADILLVETSDCLPSRAAGDCAVATFTRKIALRPAAGQAAHLPGGRPYALVSGIARPQAFEAGTVGVVGRPAALAVRLRDHQQYALPLVKRILRELDDAGVEALVTTAKDWVKLEPFWPPDRAVLVADLEVVWGQPNALPHLVEERAARLLADGR